MSIRLLSLCLLASVTVVFGGGETSECPEQTLRLVSRGEVSRAEPPFSLGIFCLREPEPFLMWSLPSDENVEFVHVYEDQGLILIGLGPVDYELLILETDTLRLRRADFSDRAVGVDPRLIAAGGNAVAVRFRHFDFDSREVSYSYLTLNELEVVDSLNHIDEPPAVALGGTPNILAVAMQPDGALVPVTDGPAVSNRDMLPLPTTPIPKSLRRLEHDGLLHVIMSTQDAFVVGTGAHEQARTSTAVLAYLRGSRAWRGWEVAGAQTIFGATHGWVVGHESHLSPETRLAKYYLPPRATDRHYLWEPTTDRRFEWHLGREAKILRVEDEAVVYRVREEVLVASLELDGPVASRKLFSSPAGVHPVSVFRPVPKLP